MGNAFLSVMRRNKKILAVALIAVLGIALILASSHAEREETEKEEKITLDSYKKTLEGEIESLCSAVEGVGKCKVVISFERGEQTVYKGSSVIEIKPPEIKGVIIACRGADNDEVRLQLVDMMTS